MTFSFTFFSPLELLGFLFALSNCTDGFMRLSKKKIKLEANVIAIRT
jgi:hypothetical protein